MSPVIIGSPAYLAFIVPVSNHVVNENRRVRVVQFYGFPDDVTRVCIYIRSGRITLFPKSARLRPTAVITTFLYETVRYYRKNAFTRFLFRFVVSDIFRLAIIKRRRYEQNQSPNRFRYDNSPKYLVTLPESVVHDCFGLVPSNFRNVSS